MSYQVLARRWRPQIFQEVVGQDHVTRTLMNAIKNNRLAHAYLFSGPRGVGKTTVARIFAKAINCEKGEPGTPCNKCPSCVQITEGTSVDVQEIDGASNRRIEEIRELRENIKYLPSSSRYKIYIIDEVHMLTKEAFNALLKTLEEPPAHAIFILATTEVEKLPDTIVSRCQSFTFKKPDQKILKDAVVNIAKKEGFEINNSAAGLIALCGDGSFRDTQGALQKVLGIASKKINLEEVESVLDIPKNTLVNDFILALSQKDINKGFMLLNLNQKIKEPYSKAEDYAKRLIETYEKTSIRTFVSRSSWSENE